MRRTSKYEEGAATYDDRIENFPIVLRHVESAVPLLVRGFVGARWLNRLNEALVIRKTRIHAPASTDWRKYHYIYLQALCLPAHVDRNYVMWVPSRFAPTPLHEAGEQ